MKNMTCLSLVFTCFFLNIVCLRAYSWEKPNVAKNLMNQIQGKINTLQKEKAEKQTKLEDLNSHLTDKQKDKIALSIKDLDSRLVELNTSKADMERLGNDKNHVYLFSNIGENGVTKSTDTEIVIHGANDALLIHEIRHVALWLQTVRDFRFSKNNFLLPIFADGSVDELQGYRAQYAFEPNSLPGVFPTDMAYVNIEFIAKIQKGDGTFAYPSIRQMWQADLKIVEQQLKLKKATQGAYSANSKQ